MLVSMHLGELNKAYDAIEQALSDLTPRNFSYARQCLERLSYGFTVYPYRDGNIRELRRALGAVHEARRAEEDRLMAQYNHLHDQGILA